LRQTKTKMITSSKRSLLVCRLVAEELLYRADEVLYSVRLSVPCLRFAQYRNAVETSNLLEV